MTQPNTEKSAPQGAALYVHWPFCKKKCPYCDFNSHVREQVDHRAWRGALLKEMQYWQQRAPGVAISSIFFGGGTPSLMEAETVAAIIAEAKMLWPMSSDIEITLEANPTSVEAGKFNAFREAGVNRVSLGVQSLKQESLSFLGREHSASEALKAVQLAQEIFPRYSFDLIYALPGQGLAVWEKELREALAFTRGHVSLYQLTIEENTAFHHAYHVQQQFALPGESLAAELYELTGQVMADAGMAAYEISNYAAPGQESRHNLAYWRGDMYFGIGPGAHGRVDLSAIAGVKSQNSQAPVLTYSNVRSAPDLEISKFSHSHPSKESSRVRTTTRNLKSPERWLDAVQTIGHGLEEETALSVEERAEEKLLMGLRLINEGARFDRWKAEELAYLEIIWRDGRLEKFSELGLLTRTTEALKVTPRGQLVLNKLIAELVA